MDQAATGFATDSIFSISKDLHRSLEHLAISLLPSNLTSQPAPPSLPIAAPSQAVHSSLQLSTPRLNPIPNQSNQLNDQRSVAPSSRPSFIDVIRADILSQPASRRSRPHLHPGPRNPLSLPPRQNLTSKNTVSHKLAKMSSLSEKGIPVCYKCGGQGHNTTNCRDPLICFSCKQTGHRAFACPKSRPKTTPKATRSPDNLQPILKPTQPPSTNTLTTTQLPPPLHLKPSFLPDSLPPIAMFPQPKPSAARHQEANLLPPMRYFATPATTQFHHSLAQGVVLSDTRHLGAQYIQAHLQRLFPIPRWSWIARELPHHQYLIAPPDLNWRTAVLHEKQLILGDIPFLATPYNFNQFNNGRRLNTYWVQIFHFPHDLWRTPELNQLASELGGILIDSDPRTIEHTNLILTRIKIAVPDKEVIPSCRNLIFTDENGIHSTHLITTIVEDDDLTHPWGLYRNQFYSLSHKRQRSPLPPPTRSASYQPHLLQATDIPSTSTQPLLTSTIPHPALTASPPPNQTIPSSSQSTLSPSKLLLSNTVRTISQIETIPIPSATLNPFPIRSTHPANPPNTQTQPNQNSSIQPNPITYVQHVPPPVIPNEAPAPQPEPEPQPAPEPQPVEEPPRPILANPPLQPEAPAPTAI